MTDANGTSRRGFLRAAAGASAVGAGAAGASAQEDGGGSGGGQTTVDMTDGLVFDPAEITIPPETTVVWENVGSSGHTVTAYEEEIPGDAEYFASGGAGSEQAARDGYFADQSGNIPGGESYEHTFSVTGEYGYFCIPHESAGMVGTITVEEGAPMPGGGGGGGGGGGSGEGPPPVPESARTLGVATVFALLSTLGLAYVFLKYSGGAATTDEE